MAKAISNVLDGVTENDVQILCIDKWSVCFSSTYHLRRKLSSDNLVVKFRIETIVENVLASSSVPAYSVPADIMGEDLILTIEREISTIQTTLTTIPVLKDIVLIFDREDVIQSVVVLVGGDTISPTTPVVKLEEKSDGYTMYEVLCILLFAGLLLYWGIKHSRSTPPTELQKEDEKRLITIVTRLIKKNENNKQV